LQRCRFGRRGSDDDRVVEGAVVLQNLDDLRHGRALLPNRDVDAVELPRFIAASVDRLLVEDGVDDHGSLAGLAVADDELALPAPDRHQAVDGLEASLHRLMHRLARDDTGRLHFYALALHVGDRAFAVDRIAETVDDATEQSATDGDVDDRAGALDR